MKTKNKTKLNRSINKTRLLLSFVTLLVIGILIINTNVRLLQKVVDLTSYIFIFYGITGLISSFNNIIFAVHENKESAKKTKFLSSLINIFLGILLFNFEKVGLSIVPVVFSLYTILNAIVKFIIFRIYLKDKVRGRYLILIEFLIFTSVGITMLFSPLIHINEIMLIIGSYCIIYSFTFLFDFIREMLPKRDRRPGVRISMPVFLTAFIPHRALKKVNEFFNKDLTQNTDHLVDSKPDYEEVSSNEQPDLEIFIHVTDDGYGKMGHMDIYYKGKIITYGNYDEASIRGLTTIGDGVLITTQKDDYIPFCIKNYKKTLFSFGIKLTEEEKTAIDERMQKIKKNTYVWKPPAQKTFEENKDAVLDGFDDYSSLIYRNMDAEFFKFFSGKFKTYFVLGTNCVLLCNTLIAGISSDIIKINGIITPGAYLDFLDNEFYKKGTKVITKRIYN